jgi:hypothetical protein
LRAIWDKQAETQRNNYSVNIEKNSPGSFLAIICKNLKHDFVIYVERKNKCAAIEMKFPAVHRIKKVFNLIFIYHISYLTIIV